jgi:hypothetical protein
MFKMFLSHFEIREFFEAAGFDLATRLLFLSVADTEQAKELLELLKIVESISKELQLDDYTKNNLYTCRFLFDSLLADYPQHDFKTHLDKTAVIVHDKHFENAIVKLQSPGDINLTAAEKEAIKVFKVTAATADEAKEDLSHLGYAERKLREDAEKHLKKLKRSEYRSVAHVANNSNRAERLFSGTKLFMTDQRKCMDPSTLEMATMLDENSDLWDALDVQEVGLGRGAGEVEEEPEIPEFDDDSEDKNRAEDIDMDVDIRAANA